MLRNNFINIFFTRYTTYLDLPKIYLFIFPFHILPSLFLFIFLKIRPFCNSFGKILWHILKHVSILPWFMGYTIVYWGTVCINSLKTPLVFWPLQSLLNLVCSQCSCTLNISFTLYKVSAFGFFSPCTSIRVLQHLFRYVTNSWKTGIDKLTGRHAKCLPRGATQRTATRVTCCPKFTSIQTSTG